MMSFLRRCSVVDQGREACEASRGPAARTSNARDAIAKLDLVEENPRLSLSGYPT